MIRLATWIIVSLAVAAGIAWLTTLPGTLTLEALGMRMQPRLGIAVFVLIVAIVAIIFIWAVLRRIIGTPYYFVRSAAANAAVSGIRRSFRRLYRAAGG